MHRKIDLSSSPANRSAAVVAHNVRRLMAKAGLSHGDLVEATGLDERTLRAVLRGVKQTRTSTLNRLATCIGATVDELFHPPLGMSAATFDVATNPIVERASAAKPDLFEGWAVEDFAELASRFGVGGQLTEDGVLEAAEQMNRRRVLLVKARAVLESKHSELLSGFVEVLFQQVRLDD